MSILGYSSSPRVGFFDFSGVLAAVAFTGFVALVAFPGFMSYDSLNMVEESRTGVQGAFPTMPVYLLRLFDVFGHGSTVMWLAQVFALNYSSWLILRELTKGYKSGLLFLLITTASPYLLGPQLVLWKDVTTAAFWALAFAMSLIYTRGPKDRPTHFLHPVLVATPPILMLIGTLIRFNGLPLFLPLFIFWLFYSMKVKPKRSMAIFTIFAIALAAILNLILASFSFPDLRTLPKNTVLGYFQTFDLVGISFYSGVSKLPIGAENEIDRVAMEDINETFSTLGILEMNNRSRGNEDFRLYHPGYTENDITSAWAKAIQDHPLAYLRYRLDLFAEIIGATPRQTFEATHYNMIDENNFGLKPIVSWLTIPVVGYIYVFSFTTIGKPWLLIAAAALTLVLLRRKGPFSNRAPLSTLVSSALLYLLTFLPLTGTGEVRYFFPSGVLLAITVSYGVGFLHQNRKIRK